MPLRTRKPLISLLAMGFLFCGKVSADQEREYQQSVAEIAFKIESLSREINKSKSLLLSQRDELANVEQQIVSLDRKLADTKGLIQRETKLISSLEQEISKLEKSHIRDKAEITRLVRQRYMRGSTNYVKMILNQENPYAVGRLSNYLEYFTKAYREKTLLIRDQIATLDDLQTKRRAGIAELEGKYALQNEQQTELAEAKRRRIKSIVKLDKVVSSDSEELDRLQKDRKRLNKLLSQLAEQAKQLRKLEQQRLAEARRKQTVASNNNKQSLALLGGGFTKQRGRLRYPVSGTAKYRFGNRLQETGLRSQGTFINTDGAQEVSTIFSGRVLFSDYLKGYGLMMIIDHGDEHISLYGHNEVLYKKVGDSVSTGEVVALSGVTGGLKSHGLYFEIRKSATPVDPGIWCK